MPEFQSIIKDKTLDQHLWEEGYAVLPFLNPKEVKALVDLFNEHHDGIQHAMYATAHVSDIAFRQKMNEGIKQACQRAIDENLENATPLGGSFIVKGKGEHGVLEPHMDWNIVDEKIYRSFNIWLPLVDVNEHNGALKILPRSHNKVEVFRAANIDNPFYEVYPLLWENMETIPMKAGEAFLYDHRLLHASAENNTDELRLAIAYGVIPSEAQMHYYYRNENKVEEYICPPSFHMTENPAEGPKGLKLNRSFDYNFPVYNQKEAAEKLGLTLPSISILQRIKQMFK